MERETGFEPATPSLEGLRSSQLSYSRMFFRIPTAAAEAGAAIRDDLSVQLIKWWGGEVSNLRRLTPTDLQSVPFGHSGTSPTYILNNSSENSSGMKVHPTAQGKMEPPKGIEPPTG